MFTQDRKHRLHRRRRYRFESGCPFRYSHIIAQHGPNINGTNDKPPPVIQMIIGDFWTPATAFGNALIADPTAELQPLLDAWVAQTVAE